MSVWLDGALIDRGDARVSAFDAGLQHGIGLFETMRGGVRGGEARVFQIEAHLARLSASVEALGLSSALRVAALEDAIRHTVHHAGHERARVRVTLTGGDLNLLAGSGGGQATILIDVQPATAYPDEMFDRGVRATIADAKANPLNPTEGHKTVNYWWRLRELQQAAGKGAGEALVFSVSNHLCGGCVSNVLVVKGGVLITPIARGEERSVGGKAALPSPVLPGTTRAWVLGQASVHGLDVDRRMLTITDVLEADEVMLTNSSWGVLPVVGLEAEPIGRGVVGEVSRRLRDAWIEALDGP